MVGNRSDNVGQMFHFLMDMGNYHLTVFPGGEDLSLIQFRFPNKAADATGFIVIFASGFFNAYT